MGKGFGFITSDGQDYFVHFTGIAGDGFRSLGDGEDVEFDKEYNEAKAKWHAVNVSGPNGQPVKGNINAGKGGGKGGDGGGKGKGGKGKGKGGKGKGDQMGGGQGGFPGYGGMPGYGPMMPGYGMPGYGAPAGYGGFPGGSPGQFGGFPG